MSSYGERLMRARKEKELTREELGKLCGITGRTIQNYELGHVTPNRIDVSQRLADVLDISVDYLIYGEKEETELTEEARKRKQNSRKRRRRKSLLTLLLYLQAANYLTKSSLPLFTSFRRSI